MSIQTIIICWLIFDAIIYLWAVLDHCYYAYDIKKKLSHINNELFEEA